MIAPLTRAYVTTGYKADAPAYTAAYGTHYGIDFSGRFGTNILSCGQGTVVAEKEYVLTGTSKMSLGNVLAVKYDNVIDINGTNRGSLIIRYCHLAYNSILVSVGQQVARGQKLATMGNSIGQSAIHLHLEIANCPSNIDDSWQSPTQKYSDTTIDPFIVMHKTSQQTLAPDCDIPLNEGPGSPTDSNNKPWYNINKIRSAPITA